MSARWREDLSARGLQQVNVARTTQGLVVANARLHPAAAGVDRGYGMEVLPVRSLTTPVDDVTADLADTVPPGATVRVDVRGRIGSGDNVAQRDRSQPNAAHPRPGRTTGLPAIGPTPPGRGADLPGVRDQGGPGGRHDRKRPRDPDKRPLRRSAIWHRAVTPGQRPVLRPGMRAGSVRDGAGMGHRTVEHRDDYWDPSGQRQEFQDLSQGTPEAQAAYQDGYNAGADEFGRQVTNPSGIDLADGTFYDVGLNDNGHVTVTYLWTG